MKSFKQVVEKLEPLFHEAIDLYRFEGESCQDILTYKTFEKLMMEDGWILSESTVKQKWKLLQSNGIIKQYCEGKAFIYIDVLSSALGYKAYTDEKNKKINFSESTEQASQEVIL